jgi:hypothetical protein
MKKSAKIFSCLFLISLMGALYLFSKMNSVGLEGVLPIFIVGIFLSYL